MNSVVVSLFFESHVSVQVKAKDAIPEGGFLHGDAAYAPPLVTPIPQAAYLMQSPIDPAGIDARIGLLPPSLDAFSRYFLMNVQ
ncbi:hypothetical protein NC651_038075 [Populus alba x Populus x berolinensis]|nr:hypothetical protein NC651_038075 [Populus alba x Populus x berolinensis]